ncbi:MAG TPA: BON domain-containing protein [Bryobacteraceae bacterium]|nr:BON domain-containing protein [Bryobacteraceae bacterium]
MQRILFLLLLPLLSAMLLFPADGKTTPAKATMAPSVSDAQLEATIRAKLAKSKIGKDGFRFRVSHGLVTWEGNTGVGQHKGAATRMARSSGATQVVNNIHVDGAGQSKTGTPLRKASVQ